MVKSIRKKCKGVCVLAGDIAPVDVLSHVPILCEESDIPYIYVPSKEVRVLIFVLEILLSLFKRGKGRNFSLVTRQCVC